jgi:hypothetical protein
MSGIEVVEVPKQRRLLALCGVVLVLFLGLWMTKGPVQQASAENFCTGVWLQPFGQNGDRCDAGKDNWGRILSVNIMTYQRAGCVNYHGWYGEYYRSWECFGNYSSGNIYVPPGDQGSYIGIIRNNNLSYGGKYNAGFYCCRP